MEAANKVSKKIIIPVHFFCTFQVDLTRELTFKNSGQTYSGIPIIASNMDTVGTFEMAQALSKVTFSIGLALNWTIITEFAILEVSAPSCGVLIN